MSFSYSSSNDSSPFRSPKARGNGNVDVFDELLCKLRSVHEEVCARNAVLEGRPARSPLQGSPSLERMFEDDPWMPINFLAPRDSPAPRRLPWGVHHTPRIFDVQAIDGLARQQECLCQGIDTLAKQQQALGQHITKALISTPAHKHQRLSLIKAAVRERHASATSGPDRSTIGAASATIGAAGISSQGMDHTRTSMFSNENNKKRFHLFSKDRKTQARKKFHEIIGTRDAAGEEPTKAGWRVCLHAFLGGTVFSLLSSLLITLYAVLIGIETDMIARDPDMDSLTIKYFHYVFTGIFGLELLLRCLADGWAAWCGSDAFWNRLDAFLIFSGLAEIFMENALGAAKSAGSVMRGVRIGRVVRTVRLIRTFRQFHDFQKMAYALISSFRTLICSLALMIFVMFFFAVWLTQSAANLEMREQIEGLGVRYGSLMSTVYTLFLSVSGGISWDECYMPLHHFSLMSAQVFIVYVVIVLFGVLNVVTSVFVDSVIRSVQHHKDLIVQDKEDEKTTAVAHMKEVFRQVDCDGSGHVSIDELDYFLQDAGLRKYMDALNIEAPDTRLLFRLLDVDGSGVISVEEFCEGCLRLKGDARSIDIHTLSFRIGNFLERWSDFAVYVEESFMEIRKKFS